VRVGGALVLLVADARDFHRYGLGQSGGVIAGPQLRKQLDTIEAARKVRMLKTLLVTGESGTGEEIAAQVFHGPHRRRASAVRGRELRDHPPRSRGAFAVRLAARRLLRRYRRARPPAGRPWRHAIFGQIAELPADVQAKLLRTLETGKVMRLGATTYERVEVRACAATWRDLRGEVGRGRFREDLYFRVGQPEVRLPRSCAPRRAARARPA
jgi:transcriptional regulator of acetoin/glycerol metabolism